MSTTTLLGWTLVHFLWQGAAVAAILALVLAFVGRRSAVVRYGIAVTALGVMALFPVATAIRLNAFVGSVAPASVASVASDPSVSPDASVASDVPASSAPVRLRPPPSASFVLSVSSVERLMPWLVALWLAGVAALALRLLGGWAWARRLTRVGTRAAPETLNALLARMAARLGVTRPVRLLESTLVHVPAVVGWLRPVLLIPVSLGSGLTTQQIEMLLAHELSHVRRHDYAINLLQAVVETVLFYHPAVWWVSRRIREEREHCCDDLAVAACGDPHGYAAALLALEQQRGPALGLAAAATGSGQSLLRRVTRLLAPAARETGQPWLAGALAATAAVAVALSLTLSRPAPADAAESEPESATQETEKPAVQGRASRPDTVITHVSPEPLEARWRWAMDTPRRARFWVGYAVQGDVGQRGWVYYDRHVPVAVGGNTTIYGHLSITDVPTNMVFAGLKLDSLVGQRAPDDMAILFGFVRQGGRVVLDRIHVGSYAFPVYFDGRSLVWLGEAPDAESVALIRSIDRGDLPQEVRKDLVTAVSIHLDSRVAVPPLIAWLTGDAPDGVRAEAAEGLAYHPDPAALAALARAARGDRAATVRAEAAEAVADVKLPAAADTLIALARTLTDRRARLEAVEGLGQRTEDGVLAALTSLAREANSTDVQMEAVETLGEVEDGRGVPTLLELARSHPRVDVRREAVETIGEAAEPDQALEALQRIANSDPNVDVQREAVETLGEIDHPRAVAVLVDIAAKHPRSDVRVEAVETIGEAAEPAEARPILERIAREDPNEDVAREAVETLGETLRDDPAALVALLDKLARELPRVEAQVEAVEALGQLQDDAAVLRLTELAARHPRLDVQREAVEALGDAAPLESARAALQRLIGELPAVELQMEAVEALGQFHDARAAATLADVARRHRRAEVRMEAIEAYAEVAETDSVVALLTDLVRPGGAASNDVRETALEALAELDDGAGIPALIEIARTHSDRAIRARAIELLGDSDDPRARRVLEDLLTRP